MQEVIKARINERDATLINDLLNSPIPIQDLPTGFGSYLDFYGQSQRLSISEKEEIGKILINLMQILKPNANEELIWNLIKENAGKLKAKKERIEDVAAGLYYISEMLSDPERNSLVSDEIFNRCKPFKVKPEI
ncbi:MAG: hypothetical protein MUO26_11590 [Methanotrichaceae archaeon]|nr:hypothetical protein [Methanotrichaceae archaeon]